MKKDHPRKKKKQKNTNSDGKEVKLKVRKPPLKQKYKHPQYWLREEEE